MTGCLPCDGSRKDKLPWSFRVADQGLGIATKADVENHFATHGTGKITEIKLMNGFGFVEYEDPMDARDVVPGKLFTSHSSSMS